MADPEIVQWLTEATPYVTAAVGAYGAAVFTRAEGAAADATVALGSRILQAVWHRGDASGRAALHQAADTAGEAPDDPSATAELRRQLAEMLLGDAELRSTLAAMLPVPATPAGDVRTEGHSNVVSRSRISGDNIQILHVGGDVRINRG